MCFWALFFSPDGNENPGASKCSFLKVQKATERSLLAPYKNKFCSEELKCTAGLAPDCYVPLKINICKQMR